jgi:hypothetical protein
MTESEYMLPVADTRAAELAVVGGTGAFLGRLAATGPSVSGRLCYDNGCLPAVHPRKARRHE